MMLCGDCGEIFDEEDAGCVHECVGEFWGSPAYQSYPVCPSCGSDNIGEYEPEDDEEQDPEEGEDNDSPE